MLNSLIGYGASPFAQDLLSRQFNDAFKPYPDVTAAEQYRKRFATEYSIINSDSKLLALYGTLRRQGYRFMLAEAPSQYIARARLKGQDYPEGQYESELRFTRVGQLEQWEGSLIVEGRQAH